LQFCCSTLAVAKERPEEFRPEQDSNPDFCNADAVLYQLLHSTAWNYCPPKQRANIVFAAGDAHLPTAVKET